MDELIQRLKKRAIEQTSNSTRFDRLPAVATPEQIAEAEDILGFRLPTLLKRIYAEIANGGFGPNYGLLGLADGKTDYYGQNVLDLYSLYYEDGDDPDWPKGMLLIGYNGCTYYSCLDCSKEDGGVFEVEPNGGKAKFHQEASSLRNWLETWLSTGHLTMIRG